MSATPPRHGRSLSLQERASLLSATSKPGIRLVPYSPPRLDPDDRAPSQASSRDKRGSGNFNDNASNQASNSRRTSWKDEVAGSDGAAQGSALPSPSLRRSSLVWSSDERVSGVKPSRSSLPAMGSAKPTAPPRGSPSDNADLHATASAPRRSRADSSPSPSSTSSHHSRQRSQSRRGTLRLAVHSNGTFSLVPEEPQSDAAESVTEDNAPSTQPSPLPSSSYTSRTPSAQDRPSIDTWSRRDSTPLTGASTVVLDQSFCDPSDSTSSSNSSSTTHLVEDPEAASPWNYRLVGGIRKVPTTPDNKRGKQPTYRTSTSSLETQLAALPESSTLIDDEEEEETPTKSVEPKPSFSSTESGQTIETVSEATNYKVYGPGSVVPESSDSLVFNSAGASNWEVLGQSSPAPTFLSSSAAASRAGNENYVVHGAPSLSPSSSLATVARRPRLEYSQESLVVAPLRPAKKRSYERFGYYKQRSRETLRSRNNSVQSLRAAAAAQDAAQAHNPGTSPNQRPPWYGHRKGVSSSSIPQNTSATVRPPGPMNASQSQPHQWSSQLSTVMSESEGGSDLARSVSPLSSERSGGHHRRHSSTGWVGSTHSRQMASMSSSIAGQLEEGAPTNTSGSDSIERPQPSYARAGPSQIRMVRDQDEHGDGLADLEDMPSMTGLSALYASGAGWNLHSNSSSRANSLTSSIPAWAQVYYGSGEHRFLGRRPSFLTVSENGTDSRPPSSGMRGSESPNSGDFNFPQTLFSPRKRAREVQPNNAVPAPDQGSMEIAQVPPSRNGSRRGYQDYHVFRTLKQKTSSIWSPHLQPDRRTTRYSVWDPPSVSWSADSGLLGKRNAQVLLFILGFVFPFAWMIAALLPLPLNPKQEMLDVESGQDEEKNPYSSTHPALRYQKYAVDESRFESARWWRNLNRGMSVVGLLIVGAVVALAVVGVRQGWGRN
ncbi:uncharacterized protein C8A04DRAFT_34580 [Dichotomopilus funicola]|uniref:Serine-rich protein n=1 Tax=Dichotomopilus funicola TaxID=1934379 RepID=A0AAN6ZPL4_9PEZI|nr:hypothetical protein C8A04DRAFT_34580 [Dichotomopilus funicola]